jgi:pimeloyl-ACP methyl ester carboxylesterase
MPEVQRNDLTLFYQDEGQGRPLLLIHGHTLDQRIWDQVAPELVVAGQRVIRPDLRGHGRSTRPAKGYHWSHHAADMVAVLDAAGIERAAIAGFSLGGGIALEMALTSPERVSRLVLIAPVMPDRPFEQEFMDNLRLVARTARSQGIAAAMAGPWAESPLFADSFTKPGVRERVAEIVRDFPGAEYLASERDQVERDWTVPGRLGEITVPTLVVSGPRDLPGFAAYAAEAAEKIPGAGQVVIPDGGHLLPLEAPELLVQHIASE